jgi:hypothetical protein
MHLNMQYSLRPILLFANTDVSSTKMCLDTFVFAKGQYGSEGVQDFRIPILVVIHQSI